MEKGEGGPLRSSGDRLDGKVRIVWPGSVWKIPIFDAKFSLNHYEKRQVCKAQSRARAISACLGTVALALNANAASVSDGPR